MGKDSWRREETENQRRKSRKGKDRRQKVKWELREKRVGGGEGGDNRGEQRKKSSSSTFGRFHAVGLHS